MNTQVYAPGVIVKGEWQFEQSNNRHFKHSSYLTYAAVHRLIMESTMVVGVTKFRLAVLLGVEKPSMVYEWLNGSKKMSAGYAYRLAKLLLMKASGVQTALIEDINWDTGDIRWRTGKDGGKSNFPQSEWDVLQGERGAAGGISELNSIGEESGEASYTRRRPDIYVGTNTPTREFPRTFKNPITAPTPDS